MSNSLCPRCHKPLPSITACHCGWRAWDSQIISRDCVACQDIAGQSAADWKARAERAEARLDAQNTQDELLDSVNELITLLKNAKAEQIAELKMKIAIQEACYPKER